MRVSETVNCLANNLYKVGTYLRMLDVCDKEGFDLDDFLFEIWKETRND